MKSIRAFESSGSVDSGNITTIAFARNVRKPVLFVGSKDGEVLVYSHAKNRTYKLDQAVKLGRNKVTCADWTDAANVFFSTGNVVHQWNLKTGKCSAIFRTPKFISCLAISKLAPYNLAVGSVNGEVAVIPLHENSIERPAINYSDATVFRGLSSEICSLAFPWTNGGFEKSVVAAASREAVIAVWDLEQKTSTLSFVELTKMRVQRNGNTKDFNFFSVSFLPPPDKKPEVIIRSTRNQSKDLQLLISDSKGHFRKLTIASSQKPCGREPSKTLEWPPNKPSANHNGVVFSISVLGRFGGGPSRKENGGGGWVSGKYKDIPLPRLAISISYDKQAIVWDVASEKAVSSFKMLSNQVRAIEFNVYSEQHCGLAAAVGGEGIRMFNFNLTKEHKLKGDLYRSDIYYLQNKKVMLTAISWNPLAFNEIAIGTYSGDVLVYDTRGRFSPDSCLYSFTEQRKKPRDSKIYSITWGPCCQEGSEARGAIYSVSSDKRLTVHVTHSKKVLDFSRICDESRDQSGITEISWRDDWRYSAIGHCSGHVGVYEHVGGAIKLLTVIACHSTLINCLKWHPLTVTESDQVAERFPFDDWLAISSDGSDITLHDLQSTFESTDKHDSNQVIDTPTKVLRGHSKRVTSLSWSFKQEGHLASVSCDEQVVRIWNVALEEACISLFTGHWDSMFSVAWCPFADDLVVSGGGDGTIQMWKPSKNLVPSLTQFELVEDAVAETELPEEDPLIAIEKEISEALKFAESVAKYPLLSF
ncbi:Gem-associated protein 5 [Halotydeus destructor]|nr:Gem-associated protein 5 [Halotydeus destructor]